MKKEFNSANLKHVAMLTMFIDHIGAGIIETTSLYSIEGWQMLYVVLRLIGRVAFPLYCFLMVEAFFHTRNRKRYLLSMLMLACITEPVFDYLFFSSWHPEYQNVLFTLAIGFAMIWILSKFESFAEKRGRFLFANAVVVLISCLVAWWLKTDYSYTGIVLIAILYLLRYAKESKCVMGAAMFLADLTAVIPFLMIYKYNGEKGELKVPKWFYKIFYPAHLAVLCLIKKMI